MKEVEIKVLEINPEEEKKKLVKLGFKKLWEGLILEKTFDSEDKYLKKNKQLLRLRKAYDKVELTFKDKSENHSFLKMREEKEVIVDSFDKAEDILFSLGYKCMSAREKKRSTYTKENVKVEIDEYPGAKPYLEVEGTSDEILNVLKLLNHPIEKTSNNSSTQILKLYGLNTKNLFFENKTKQTK
ncbi:class IV adenylate cyclase [Candidatus Woesearchaeota archaeon]|nr:class IV adenylate cyclase [Candidatus Woesearchaeota archaeon]